MKIIILILCVLLSNPYSYAEDDIAIEYIVPNQSRFTKAIEVWESDHTRPKDGTFSYEYIYEKSGRWISFKYCNGKIHYAYSLSNEIKQGIQNITTYDKLYLDTLITQLKANEVTSYIGDHDVGAIAVTYGFPNGKQASFYQFTPFQIDQYLLKKSELKQAKTSDIDYKLRNIHFFMAGLAKQTSKLSRVINIAGIK